MIKSIKDNVLNDESSKLTRSIYKNDTDLYGDVIIEQNPNSGFIYACDEDGNCYMFSDNKNTKLEKWINCPNCGYENYTSEFRNELTDDCCIEYAIELAI